MWHWHKHTLHLEQMESCFLCIVIKTVFCIPVGSTSADSEPAGKKGQLYYAIKYKELENALILVLSGVLWPISMSYQDSTVLLQVIVLTE